MRKVKRGPRRRRENTNISRSLFRNLARGDERRKGKKKGNFTCANIPIIKWGSDSLEKQSKMKGEKSCHDSNKEWIILST